MKTSFHGRHRFFAVAAAALLGYAGHVAAAPPPAPPRQQEEKNVFKKMGGFLFKKTRELEKSQEPPKPVAPPRRSTASSRPKRKSSETSSSNTLQPIPGLNPASGETQYLREESSAMEDDADARREGADEKEGVVKPLPRKTSPGEVAGPPAPLKYAIPVMGRPGFVFPPGAEKVEGNMLDVRGLNPGQKARDPRTGALFLVP